MLLEILADPGIFELNWLQLFVCSEGYSRNLDTFSLTKSQSNKHFSSSINLRLVLVLARVHGHEAICQVVVIIYTQA